jgi:hypothetical protein
MTRWRTLPIVASVLMGARTMNTRMNAPVMAIDR